MDARASASCVLSISCSRVCFPVLVQSCSSARSPACSSDTPRVSFVINFTLFSTNSISPFCTNVGYNEATAKVILILTLSSSVLRNSRSFRSGFRRFRAIFFKLNNFCFAI